MANGVFKVAPFDGLIFIYQSDSVGYASKRVFWKFIDFELYELYCASYLCRGIGQTSCSFEHVSCWSTFLPLIVWVYIHWFSRNYASKSNPLNLKLLVRKPSFM